MKGTGFEAMSWQAAVERTVGGLGYEVVDLERGARGLLRVFIDRIPGHAYADAGAAVTVEDCERVTRQLQLVLEVEGLAYERLEVSSPGLDRPLKRAADYERYAGQELALTLKQALKGRKNYRGRLVPAAAGWRLEMIDGDQALDFTLDEVREARLVPVLDFKGRRTKADPAAQAPVDAHEVDGGLDR